MMILPVCVRERVRDGELTLLQAHAHRIWPRLHFVPVFVLLIRLSFHAFAHEIVPSFLHVIHLGCVYTSANVCVFVCVCVCVRARVCIPPLKQPKDGKAN